MGIINVTPDSFSDGGDYYESRDALSRVHALFEEGADLVDIGAESSRPGAEPVSPEEEWRRLFPVLKALPADILPKISVDTYKPQTMIQAAKLGVGIINDIRGGADDSVLMELSKFGVCYIAMHMHLDPKSMQQQPLEPCEALKVAQDFYHSTKERLLNCGFQQEQVWLDPGIGFGKTDAANLQLIAHALDISDKYPIVLGISRKSFIGRILDLPDPGSRDDPSKMLELGFMLRGVKAIRTHEVSRLAKMKEYLC
jgi:dihydropteroate synthase